MLPYPRLNDLKTIYFTAKLVLVWFANLMRFIDSQVELSKTLIRIGLYNSVCWFIPTCNRTIWFSFCWTVWSWNWLWKSSFQPPYAEPRLPVVAGLSPDYSPSSSARKSSSSNSWRSSGMQSTQRRKTVRGNMLSDANFWNSYPAK